MCKTGNHRPNIGNHILCRFCRDWLWLLTGGQKLSLIQFFPKATHLVAQRHWSSQTGCGHSNALAKGQVSISCQHRMGWFLLIGKFVFGKKFGCCVCCGTKELGVLIYLFLLEECRYLGLPVLCENLLWGWVGASVSKLSLWGLWPTDSSTHCSKLAKDLTGRGNLGWLWMCLGLPYLTKI